MPQREHQNTQDDASSEPSGVITSFDELTKGLATGAVSRRKALRWMGSALVGAALASVPGVAWGACPEGQTRRGDRCVNLQTNERHCGSCSNRCAEEQECVGGVCQGGCPSGTTLCSGACVSNVCPQGQVFNNSACQCGCTYTAVALCGGNCVRNCFLADQYINCSTCQCEGGSCPSGYTEIPYPDFGSFCCPNAQVCGTGGAVACCNTSGFTCVIDSLGRGSCQPA